MLNRWNFLKTGFYEGIIPSVRERVLASQFGSDSVARLDMVETKLNDFIAEPNYCPFGDMPPSDVGDYQKMFQALATVSSSPRTAKELMAGILLLARIHRRTGMDGVRTAEGGEGVTGAMIRARTWVDGRLAGGLQAFLGAPMAAYSGCGERDGGIGHGKRRSRTGLARVCGDVGLAGGSVADGRRQAGSGMARSRARARLNCSSQGQRRGRCRVNRRAERVIRPAKAKTRRLRVLVVTIC